MWKFILLYVYKSLIIKKRGSFMDCIVKMREFSNELTKKEKQLSEYILENLEEVKNLNTQKLSERTGISQATITRFSKKIGYSGFPDFKIALSATLAKAKAIKSERKVIHDKISIDDTYEDIRDKIAYENIGAIKDTVKILKGETLEEVVDILDGSKRIFLLGIGFSALVAKDFLYKLLKIGKNAVFEIDPHVQLANLSSLTPQDSLFAISHSGKTLETYLGVKKAKEIGAKIITLTKLSDNTLSELADVKLHTLAEEVSFRSSAISSRIAQLTVIDMIFIGLTKKYPEKALEYIDMSSELVKELKLK